MSYNSTINLLRKIGNRCTCGVNAAVAKAIFRDYKYKIKYKYINRSSLNFLHDWNKRDNFIGAGENHESNLITNNLEIQETINKHY